MLVDYFNGPDDEEDSDNEIYPEMDPDEEEPYPDDEDELYPSMVEGI